jgi:hypothetical protein
MTRGFVRKKVTEAEGRIPALLADLGGIQVH